MKNPFFVSAHRAGVNSRWSRVGIALFLTAQGALAADGQKPTGDVVNLSPFVVSEESINGYTATQTLSGTRLRSDARDVGSAMTILTPDFLDDIGATDITSAFDFVP